MFHDPSTILHDLSATPTTPSSKSGGRDTPTPLGLTPML